MVDLIAIYQRRRWWFIQTNGKEWTKRIRRNSNNNNNIELTWWWSDNEQTKPIRFIDSSIVRWKRTNEQTNKKDIWMRWIDDSVYSIRLPRRKTESEKWIEDRKIMSIAQSRLAHRNKLPKETRENIEFVFQGLKRRDAPPA